MFEKYIKIDMTVILLTMYRLIPPSLPFFPQNALRHASQMADLRKMWKSNSHMHCPTSPCKTLDPSLNISWLTDSKALAFSLPQCQNKTTLKCFLSVDLYSNDALCKDGNFLFTGYMSWGHIWVRTENISYWNTYEIIALLAVNKHEGPSLNLTVIAA